jgi:phosphate transport system substrate-binding protein
VRRLAMGFSRGENGGFTSSSRQPNSVGRSVRDGNPAFDRRSQRLRFQRLGLAMVAIALAAGAASTPKLDPDLPRYRKTEGLAGTLTAVGSDTMLVLQTLMAEEFRRLHPQVTVELDGKGSSTAPPALVENTAQLGNMSRRIKGVEADAFEDRFGYRPVRFDVALDTVGVFVNQSNPLNALTVPEVDAIFSKARRCGHPEDLSVWRQLGLDGDWRGAPISIYGRNAASGTYGYFKEHALCRGDYKDTVKEQPGSASVVQGVENDRYGIGYSGIGYATSGVRAVPIAPREGEPAVEATWENAANGRYPFARFLEIYVNKAPDRPFDPLVEEYLRFMLSAEGQRIVIKAGFHPLDAASVTRQLSKLTE